jgi:hypothetical protein
MGFHHFRLHNPLFYHILKQNEYIQGHFDKQIAMIHIECFFGSDAH